MTKYFLLRTGLVFLSVWALTIAASYTPRKILKVPHADSVKNPAYVQRHLVYGQQYSFIAYDDNHFEWKDTSALKPFFEKLKHVSNKQLRIVQIGDSHIQSGVFTAEFRKRLQNTFGEGGRGLIFPYSAAGTNSADDYLCDHSGYWTSARNIHKNPSLPLGVSGVSVQTRQSGASFKMTFREGILKPHFNKIRVFCKLSTQSFDLDVYYNPAKPPMRVRCSPQAGTGYPYTEITLPEVPSRVLEFRTVRTKPEQSFWEGYGIQIISKEDSGVLYSSAGINGAGFASLLRQDLFNRQLSAYEPDLVILDIGVNDYYGGGFPAAYMERGLNKIIDSIRTAAPDACILITNPQDVARGRSHVTGGELYAGLSRKVAMERGCAYYDYHRIAGGKYSVRKWSQHDLVAYDMLHLSSVGYKLKGELFFNALLNTYLTWLINPTLAEFVLENTPSFDAESAVFASTKPVIETREAEVVKKKTSTASSKTVGGKGAKVSYTIRNGDNLGFIAGKFNVSVSELKRWNGLTGNTIVAGRKLVIYQSGYVASTKTSSNQSATSNSKSSKNTQSVVKGKIVHRVVNGDNLWDIARKYGSSVAQIKKLNGLSSDKLQIGMQLLIQK